MYGGGAFTEVICCLATAAEHPAVSFAALFFCASVIIIALSRAISSFNVSFFIQQSKINALKNIQMYNANNCCLLPGYGTLMRVLSADRMCHFGQQSGTSFHALC